MRKTASLLLYLFCSTLSLYAQQPVNFLSLLKEMSDRSALARFPHPDYASLQSSSYNRVSVVKDSAGWFADSDGIGFIRTEKINGKEEWVVMEHDGPGAITKIWAPYFYYGGLNDLEGPDINIYLDGSATPVISENFFRFITGRGSVPPPLAQQTARAGNSYLPIPFAKGCVVTFSRKPFYHIINYRGYPKGTKVSSFSMDQLYASLPQVDRLNADLHRVYMDEPSKTVQKQGILKAGEQFTLSAATGGAIRQLQITLDPKEIKSNPEILRKLILSCSFDGEETVWSPVGDFFGSANALNPFRTFTRAVNASGQMVCTWAMPFKSNAKIQLQNTAAVPVHVTEFAVRVSGWTWDQRSMHFHASWKPDEILPGSTFTDMNLVDIKGRGVIVGDALTVLSPAPGWWGEGDEKIYVDDAWDKQFPTHFGTGTEDYYGWAGGENPFKDDVFSHPYLSNIEVGSATKTRQGVRGFNICTRVRALDAIPFRKHLVFDMEASPGTQIRNAWDFLGYSTIVFWYAVPGAVHNRPRQPQQLTKPIITLEELDSRSSDVRKLLSK